ncbi:glycosyl hydrolase [Sorangium sp. So ce321]|uniref:glycosyl hydrolase n=1 Tax=Sorangium sp. So ce321 TaxID=3133300 RepID=UPI003F5EF3A4
MATLEEDMTFTPAAGVVDEDPYSGGKQLAKLARLAQIAEAVGKANDHHFHYGYFLYAAAVLAKGDADWRDEYGDKALWLVRDIGRGPERRAAPSRSLAQSIGSTRTSTSRRSAPPPTKMVPEVGVASM